MQPFQAFMLFNQEFYLLKYNKFYGPIQYNVLWLNRMRRHIAHEQPDAKRLELIKIAASFDV